MVVKCLCSGYHDGIRNPPLMVTGLTGLWRGKEGWRGGGEGEGGGKGGRGR